MRTIRTGNGANGRQRHTELNRGHLPPPLEDSSKIEHKLSPVLGHLIQLAEILHSDSSSFGDANPLTANDHAITKRL